MQTVPAVSTLSDTKTIFTPPAPIATGTFKNTTTDSGKFTAYIRINGKRYQATDKCLLRSQIICYAKLLNDKIPQKVLRGLKKENGITKHPNKKGCYMVNVNACLYDLLMLSSKANTPTNPKLDENGNLANIELFEPF